MIVTSYLASKSGGLLKIQPELNHSAYSAFDDGGIECEVGEFLYALVRMAKPGHILETGTRLGVAASYMALALHENNSGHLTTIEINADYTRSSKAMLESIGIAKRVTFIIGDACQWNPGDTRYDLVFLDTELHMRFPDMARLWPSLAPGGLLVIHDLHPHMEQRPGDGEGRGYFGPLPERIDALIRTHELQSLHFRTPRGLYLCQKAAPDFYTSQVLGYV